MTSRDAFPDNAVPTEELRQLYNELFNRQFAEHPEHAQYASERAEDLSCAFIAFSNESSDHPAVPTLKRGLKKILFTFTDRKNLNVTPTNEDMAMLLLEFYDANENNLQITANAIDSYAHWMPLYAQEVRVALGEQWEQMDGSERMALVRRFAHEQMRED